MVFHAGSLNGPTLDTFSPFFFSFGPFPPTAMMKDYATCSIKYPRQSHHKCVVEIFLLCFVSRTSARIFKGITPANSCFRWCIFPADGTKKSNPGNQIKTRYYIWFHLFFQGFYYTIAKRGITKCRNGKKKNSPPSRYFQSNQCQKDIEKSCRGGGGFLVDLRPPEREKRKKTQNGSIFPCNPCMALPPFFSFSYSRLSLAMSHPPKTSDRINLYIPIRPAHK
jgi:hypothetical protein